MRVVHTVEFYWPRIGGAERVVQRISECLANRGHEVTILTSSWPGFPREDLVNGVRVRRFDVTGNAARQIRGAADEFIEELLSGEYDVLLNYACQSWPTDLSFRVLDRIRAGKVIAPCGYSALRDGPLRRLLYRSYFRQLPAILRRYDAVVYHSQRYTDYGLGQRWGLTNGHVIPNGVDRAEFSPSGAKRPRRVVAVGNHYRAKGHPDFLRLARRMGSSQVEFCLVAVPERHRGCFDACQREAARSGVRLVDGRDRARVTQTIAQSSVLVLTSSIECAPLAPLEAMAAGTPFVSYDVGCVRDYPGGLVVRDSDQLCAWVRALLGDGALWSRLSAAGRRFTAALDWEQICDRYERLYGQVVARAGRERTVRP